MSTPGTGSLNRFQVDLSGMVELLSQHLYSGPQVYIRELLQNGVDAITASHEADAAAPAKIWLRLFADPTSPALEVLDCGIGLTASQAEELLATIGKSSKRDSELGFGRAEFLGQFGIGMLAAFMIADKITVISQSRLRDASGQLPAPVSWVGNADGTFTVTPADPAAVPAEIREGGTMVRLVARRDTAHWLSYDTVLSLAKHYGELLPFEVLLAKIPTAATAGTQSATGVGEAESTAETESTEAAPRWQRITRPLIPWQEDYISERLRESALDEHCRQTFGFKPLASIDLNVPALGITGVAYVLPQQVAPGTGQHRVYLKQMLLGDRIDTILPEWAFFVRAVINTDSLSPTASRETLHEDETLELAREALGAQLKQWIEALLNSAGPAAVNFLSTHNLALRAVGAQDSEMLELISRTVPFESTAGPLTLAEAAQSGELLFTSTVEDFKRAQTVARAAGLTVINAGYAYDTDIIAALERELGWQTRQLASEDLTAALTAPDVGREISTAAALSRARELLATQDCEVLLRSFEPDSLPAMLLLDQEARFQAQLRQHREESPGLWEGMLDSFVNPESVKSRTLVLNDSASLVQTLLASDDAAVFAAGLASLYVTTVAASGESLTGSETNMLSNSLESLLLTALGATGAQDDNTNGESDTN